MPPEAQQQPNCRLKVWWLDGGTNEWTFRGKPERSAVSGAVRFTGELANGNAVEVELLDGQVKASQLEELAG